MAGRKKRLTADANVRARSTYDETLAKGEIREAIADLKRARVRLVATQKRLEALPACRETDARVAGGDYEAMGLAWCLSAACGQLVPDELDPLIRDLEAEVRETHATIKAKEKEYRAEARRRAQPQSARNTGA